MLGTAAAAINRGRCDRSAPSAPTSEPTDPEDHRDRIDFVFARAPMLEVISAGIVGEKAPEADIIVTPWPADHRAVVATARF